MSNIATRQGYIDNFRNVMAGDAIKKQFQAVLKDKAAGFMVSLMNFYMDNATNDKALEPTSVIKSALTAAALDLPIEKNLGFAYLVPYEFKSSGLNQVNFQLGYKGYIQLALRTAQYKRMTASPVYEEQFISWNRVTEDLELDNTAEVDFTKKPYGYVFYFRLANGYEKTIFKTHSEVDAHAKRYSSGYKAFLDKKVKSSIWNDNFEAMALKTVVKEGISKWGIMSVEMIEAFSKDSDDSEPEKVKKDISRAESKVIDISGAEIADDKQVTGEVVGHSNEEPEFARNGS